MYNHKEIEKKWQSYWEKNSTFKVKSPTLESIKKPKYYCLDMFPYPSWAWLHVGHPEWFTANDIIARYKNAKWFNVLHPMWWDAFWLPAENYAIKTGTHPKITTNQNIDTFRKQIKKIWFSYDWDREIDTTDPSYYKWTQWIFLKLFEKWLAYEQDLPINYCPSCKTWLANEEVLNDFTCERCGTKVEKRKIRQWVLAITKYAERLLYDVDKLDWPDSIKEMQRNWIWKSEGCEFEMKLAQKKWELPISEGVGLNVQAKLSSKNILLENTQKSKLNVEKDIPKISVYTTRIDTVFGMTYAILAPDHPKVNQFITPNQESICRKYIEKSKKMSDQDRTTDNKEKTGVFTGSYLINPFNWKEVPLWIWDYVLGNYGTWAVMAVPAHDERDFEFAKKYSLEIVQTIWSEKSSNEDKDNWIEAEKHKSWYYIYTNIAYKELWFLLNSWDFDWLTSNEAKQKLMNYAEEKGFWKKKINYKLRDWLFSRQRYWWEPIPLIHIEKEELKKLPRISESDYEKQLEKIEEIINKKMKATTLKTEGGTHNGTTAKPSLKKIILKNTKNVKKINKKFNMKSFYKTFMRNENELIINWRYLFEHIKLKSRNEQYLRKNNALTIFENIHNLNFISDKYGFITIKWKYWIIVFEKLEEKKLNLLTFYPFSELNSFFNNKAQILKQIIKKDSNNSKLSSKWEFESIVINWKITGKIYSWIYSDIICDYDLPLKLPEVKNYEPAWDWNSPLSKVEDFVNVKLAWNLNWKRETNTMPQWGWSCWYYLRYMDPKNETDLVSREVEKYWGQVDSYVWWAEHAVLHLLYARFWHKFLYDIWVVSNDEPFYRLRNQGLILAHAFERKNWWLLANDLVEEKNWKFYEKQNWQEVKKIISKMSKSLKNVVNPDDIIEKYWADSLRLYEMYMADFKDPAPWDDKGIVWVRRFLDRVYEAFKIEDNMMEIDDSITESKSDEKSMKLLHKTIKKVEEDIENYKFNTAIASLIILLKNIPNLKLNSNEWFNFRRIFLKLLHPFAPHLSEELWEQGRKYIEEFWDFSEITIELKKSIFFASWPEYDKNLVVDDSVVIWVQIMWKLRWEIEVFSDEDKDSVLEKAKNNENVCKWLEWKQIVKEIYVPLKIVNLVVK